MIYFIQETGTLAIKIGYSNYSGGRIGSLQVGNPYALVQLGTVDGDRDSESAFHWQFRKHRMKGEWFSREIAQDIKLLLAKDGTPEWCACLADYFDVSITLNKLSSLTGDSAKSLRQWMRKDGIRGQQSGDDILYGRAESQVFLSGFQIDDVDLFRQLLIAGGKEFVAQVSLFKDEAS